MKFALIVYFLHLRVHLLLHLLELVNFVRQTFYLTYD